MTADEIPSDETDAKFDRLSPEHPVDLDKLIAEERKNPVFEAAWQAVIRRERESRRRHAREVYVQRGWHLSAMRSSYRSRMIARRRRG